VILTVDTGIKPLMMVFVSQNFTADDNFAATSYVSVASGITVSCVGKYKTCRDTTVTAYLTHG
jgi:hypothetical protein